MSKITDNILSISFYLFVFTNVPVWSGALSSGGNPPYVYTCPSLNVSIGSFNFPPTINTKLSVHGLSYFNGNMGIGTTTPDATLQVNTVANGVDGSVVFIGPNTPTFTTPPPVIGAGNRLMWVPDYGAFRAGKVDNDQWDGPYLGHLSFATGENTIAQGDHSLAMGINTGAYGHNHLQVVIIHL